MPCPSSSTISDPVTRASIAVTQPREPVSCIAVKPLVESSRVRPAVEFGIGHIWDQFEWLQIMRNREMEFQGQMPVYEQFALFVLEGITIRYSDMLNAYWQLNNIVFRYIMAFVDM